MSKEFNYIDIHSHLNFPAYDADRDEVIRRMRDAGVATISVGTDLETSKSAVQLAEQHENIWATIGMHPVFAGESHNDPQETGKVGDDRRLAQEFAYEAFKKLAVHPKVVAIGECGLDYFHSKPEDIKLQREVFIQHIKLANEAGKPLMLHVRSARPSQPQASTRVVDQASAYLEAVQILKEHSKVQANFHFFAGNVDDLKAILEIGATVSFTGVLTFVKNYDELIKMVPIDSIMSETDSPYVLPAPYRGKRNEPMYVIEIVKAIARIRGVDEAVIAGQLVRNTRKFFGI
jgi:TatD DNase family protein